MNEVVDRISKELLALGYTFSQKPIVIGGMAMEYYGMRKSGADIDLVICDSDYQVLAERHPEKRKDIFGDFGVVINQFEIWRSIALLDYDFYKYEAIEFEYVNLVSLDRLLFMRVSAMEVEKYKKDLETMKEYYYSNFRNHSFLAEAEKHIVSYDKNKRIIFGGKYEDNLIV